MNALKKESCLENKSATLRRYSNKVKQWILRCDQKRRVKFHRQGTSLALFLGKKVEIRGCSVQLRLTRDMTRAPLVTRPECLIYYSIREQKYPMRTIIFCAFDQTSTPICPIQMVTWILSWRSYRNPLTNYQIIRII